MGSTGTMKKRELIESVNWEAALAAPREALGHDEVMASLFLGVAHVVCSWVDGGYDGDLAYAYKFSGGSVAIVTDYFGSCSYCDQWEDCPDDDARVLIRTIVNNARLFPSVEEAARWCAEKKDDEGGEDFSFRAAANLTFEVV